jgi:hypothetical protein
MIFAHAPIVFPAVLGRPLAFRRWFYLHVLLLHVSLVWRIAGDLAGSFSAFRWGGLLTITAVLLFLGDSIAGIVIGQREAKGSSRTSKNPLATPGRGS